MALVLKESSNATTIGEQTFGKGVAQDLILYKDGSALKYTNHKRYGSNKTNIDINQKGILPDHQITLNQNQRNKRRQDNQLEFAIKR